MHSSPPSRHTKVAATSRSKAVTVPKRRKIQIRAENEVRDSKVGATGEMRTQTRNGTKNERKVQREGRRVTKETPRKRGRARENETKRERNKERQSERVREYQKKQQSKKKRVRESRGESEGESNTERNTKYMNIKWRQAYARTNTWRRNRRRGRGVVSKNGPTPTQTP